MKSEVFLAALLLLVPAAPLQAAPISASVWGCVTVLPEGAATWISTEHFQFVAFWDAVSGCEPTIAHPVVLHEWLENFDGAGGLKVQALQSLVPKCGRVQFDAHAYLGGPNLILDPFGLVSLVLDTGVDCEVLPTPPIRPFGGQLPETDTLWLIGIGAALTMARVYSKRPV